MLLIFVYCNKSVAQQNHAKIDSIINVLTNYKSKCETPCLKDSSKVRTLLKLGAEYNFSNPDSAFYFDSLALDFSTRANWQAGVYYSNHSLGYYFARKGGYDSSKNHYAKAISIAQNLTEKGNDLEKKEMLPALSRTLGNTGTIYLNQGDVVTSLDYFFKSLKIEETLKNEGGISKDLILIGSAFDEQKQYQRAIEYNLQALVIEEKLKNLDRLSALLGNLGIEYTKLGKIDIALNYYNRALKAAKDLGDPSRIGGLLANIGEIYANQKSDYKNAERYLSEALSYTHSVGDQYTTGQILNNFGYLYLSLNDYIKSEQNFTNALNTVQVSGDRETMELIYQGLSNLFVRKNDYRKALLYFKQATLLHDTLFNEEKNNSLAEKEITYQFEKKQDSIKVVQDNKDAITQAEISKQKLIRNSVIGGAGAVALIGVLSFVSFRNKRRSEKAELSEKISVTEMKALRSQMNPHFIFNALQSIQTFLLNHRSEEANTYLLKFSKLMRAVLENSQHSEIQIKDDIQALELYMQLESIRLKHPFTYKFHVDNSIDTKNDNIPPLILQPFVENAIWHGLQYKNEPGHIDVYLSKKDNVLEAIVEDNGVGRDMSKKVAQPMLLKKESLGMKITEERLKVLNETKKVKSHFLIKDLFTKNNEPAGTKVELSLPLTA